MTTGGIYKKINIDFSLLKKIKRRKMASGCKSERKNDKGHSRTLIDIVLYRDNVTQLGTKSRK